MVGPGGPTATPSAFPPVRAGRINFDGMEGRRIKFDVTDTTFTSHGATLVGRLILPKGTAVVPIVTLVHGAEHDSARRFNALQRMLPAEEVGAFVFDKRGTGGSDCSYSQDFNLLADDAVAAMREAKRLSGGAQDGSAIRLEAKADGPRRLRRIARTWTLSSFASASQ